MKRNNILVALTFAAGCGGSEGSTSKGSTNSGWSSTSVTTQSEVETIETTSAPGSELSPWYSVWFAQTVFGVNHGYTFENGGGQLFLVRFGFALGEAFIEIESCDADTQKYEYTWTLEGIGEDGRIRLEPVDTVHYYPSQNVKELYVLLGDSCSSLEVIQETIDGQEASAFAAIGSGLLRGDLCLERCASSMDDYGVISDCGTPVPWACEP